jgi:xanthine dehydrogenase iron-sulfur cluster and FAD-binding subunit A
MRRTLCPCEPVEPAEYDVKAALAGNLCRRTGYSTIVEAVKAAAQVKRQGGRPPC